MAEGTQAGGRRRGPAERQGGVGREQVTDQRPAPAPEGDGPSDAGDEATTGDQPATGDSWRPRPWESPAMRAEVGRAARKRVPRSSHAAFDLRPGREPIAILAAQEADRLPHLLPLRHERMAGSAFAYYRGTAAVMAFDLAETPRSDIVVQASGDAHISNFGLFASPERSLVFDANDFDETLPGPWEWDVKRLATSVVVAGGDNGFTPAQCRRAALATVRAYRLAIHRYASMRLLDVWYAAITEADIRAAAEATGWLEGRTAADRRRRLEALFARARRRDGLRAFVALTAVVDGRRVILDDPPVITHVDRERVGPGLERVFADYRASLPEARRALLARYRFVDVALKVVGVGSVGTRCYVIVAQGRDEDDPLILQAKEATASVLEPHVGPSRHASHAQRVVVGQQLTQATPDIFLGWTRGPAGRDFYVRQLWDMKGSIDVASLQPPGLEIYGRVCAWALARGHARTGDATAIAAYLGEGDVFDGAVADFAETYAAVNRHDHAAYVAAIRAGRVAVPTG